MGQEILSWWQSVPVIIVIITLIEVIPLQIEILLYQLLLSFSINLYKAANSKCNCKLMFLAEITKGKSSFSVFSLIFMAFVFLGRSYKGEKHFMSPPIWSMILGIWSVRGRPIRLHVDRDHLLYVSVEFTLTVTIVTLVSVINQPPYGFDSWSMKYQREANQASCRPGASYIVLVWSSPLH